jgi:hypothetical protein
MVAARQGAKAVRSFFTRVPSVRAASSLPAVGLTMNESLSIRVVGPVVGGLMDPGSVTVVRQFRGQTAGADRPAARPALAVDADEDCVVEGPPRLSAVGTDVAAAADCDQGKALTGHPRDAVAETGGRAPGCPATAPVRADCSCCAGHVGRVSGIAADGDAVSGIPEGQAAVADCWADAD